MRAYFFVNSALSGIQKGIQVAHCVAEMANMASAVASWTHDKAARDADPEEVDLHDAYFDWSRHNKTIIVLEGGFNGDLVEIVDFLAQQNIFPCASFTEDEETMNRMMTCVGIILPERIYEVAKWTREKTATLRKDSPEEEWRLFGERSSEWNPYTDWEVELIKLINSCPLAR